MARTVLKWDGGFVEFDAVELESPTHDAVLTQYPVENGADLVDHMRTMPTVLRLAVVVSNHPSRDVKSHIDGFTTSRGVDIKARVPIIPGPPSAQLPTSIAGLDLSREVTLRAQVRVWEGGAAKIRRVSNVYAELRNAQREARLFSVVTDVASYDAMLLKSIRFDRTAQMSQAIRMELELHELLTAYLTTRDVSGLLAAERERSKPAKDAGKQQATEADPATEAKGTFLWGLLK